MLFYHYPPTHPLLALPKTHLIEYSSKEERLRFFSKKSKNKIVSVGNSKNKQQI